MSCYTVSIYNVDIFEILIETITLGKYPTAAKLNNLYKRYYHDSTSWRWVIKNYRLAVDKVDQGMRISVV